MSGHLITVKDNAPGGGRIMAEVHAYFRGSTTEIGDDVARGIALGYASPGSSEAAITAFGMGMPVDVGYLAHNVRWLLNAEIGANEPDTESIRELSVLLIWCEVRLARAETLARS